MMHRRLTAIAMVLAGLAALLGSPRAPGSGALSAATAVEAGMGRASIIDVAQWIREQPDGLDIVDLRSELAFEDFHIPTARQAALSDLLRDPAALTGRVVLYADAGPLAAQAFALLRGATDADLRYLGDGASAWLTTLMSPVLPSDATPDELLAWAHVSEISRYFGGMPRRGGPRPNSGAPAWYATPGADATAEVADLVASAKRKGCGF